MQESPEHFACTPHVGAGSETQTMSTAWHREREEETAKVSPNTRNHCRISWGDGEMIISGGVTPSIDAHRVSPMCSMLSPVVLKRVCAAVRPAGWVGEHWEKRDAPCSSAACFR